MAVTILERPEGYIIDQSAGISNTVIFLTPAAGITETAHGLVSGDVIYIQSDIEEYNGFVKIDLINANQFRLRNISDTAYIDYLQDAAATFYYTLSTHGWSAVHLPITYRLSTNLYPTNSADTTRNINSVQDANGYTVLQLSGSLGSIHTYDFVKVTVPNDTDLSQIYQILEFISPTVILINLVYDSTNNFTSATALKHYNNYNILVRVYAGLNSGHLWTLQKPYELAATLEFIPDDNNEVFFSINELLKSYIETRNNLVLGTLPCNIDFFCQFYIETAETYDDSDGYVFGTTISAFTSDQSNFEGYAANAKLEFKNLFSGYMSEYFMDSNASGYTPIPAKFLTLFDELTFNPNYFDLSVVMGTAGYYIQRSFYTLEGGYIGSAITVGTQVDGIIRIQISDVYPIVKVTLYSTSFEVLSETKTIKNICKFTNGNGSTVSSALLNLSVGVNFTSPPNDQLVTSADQARYITADPGNKGTIAWTASIAPFTAGDTMTITLQYYDIAAVTVESHTIKIVTTTLDSGNFSLPVPTVDVYGFRITWLLHNVSTNSTFISNVTGTFAAETVNLYTTTVGNCCEDELLDLTWLNNLGGFEYFRFGANKDHIREIQEAITTKKNILPTWPKSYGADADTIKKQTLRVSNKAYTIRSQFLTTDEVDAISFIKSSILVQILTSRTDRRTVIVDTDSFVVRADSADTKEIAFNVSFTDDIPVQKL